MTYSLTGIAYLALFLALGFLTFRFFQYWRQKKDITSKVFLALGASFALFAFIRAASVLFFADNAAVLIGSAILIVLIQSFAAASVVYLIIYLKFPKISPRLGFAAMLILGLIVTVLSLNIQYYPTPEAAGALAWKFFSPELGALYFILRMTIILAIFAPLIFILIQQFLRSEDALVKKRAFGLISVFLLAIMFGFVDFILNSLLGMEMGAYRDYAMIFISFIIFMVIFLTYQPRALEDKTI